MIAAYYESVFLLSVLFTLLYAVMWNKHFDIHFTLIFIFVPISELGYFMLVSAEDKGAALAANKLIYIGGCFLMLFIMLSVFHLCRIKLKSYVQAFFVVFSLIVYMSVLTIGRGKIFYKTVQFKQEDGAGMLYDKTYGFMHIFQEEGRFAAADVPAVSAGGNGCLLLFHDEGCRCEARFPAGSISVCAVCLSHHRAARMSLRY